MNSLINSLKKHKWYYIMLLPAIFYFIIFRYLPMFGFIIAFKNYNLSSGMIGFFTSPWAGFEHFQMLFSSSLFLRALRNTIMISLYHLTVGFPAPIIIALLLNELTNQKLKRIVQSSIYLPHFISWPVIGGIVYAILSPEHGVLSLILKGVGLPAIDLLTNQSHFRSLLVFSNIWKEAGWGTIIYLAALTSINPELYEAAMLDGAGRLKRLWHVSLPGIRNIIFVLLLLRIGNIMNAGMLQVLSMYNPLVYEVSEIIDTFIYKTGIMSQRFSFTTAAGLFNSTIGFVLIVSANKLKKKFTDESLW